MTLSHDTNHIGYRLNEIARHYDISPRQLALKSGIHPHTISKNIKAWRDNKEGIMPDSNTLKKIASVFTDIRMDWLVTGSGPMLQVDVLEDPQAKYDVYWKDKYNELKDLYTEKLEKIEKLNDEIRELRSKLEKTDVKLLAETSRKVQ